MKPIQMEVKMNLQTHILRLKEFIERTKNITDELEVRHSVNPTIFLWRNRFQAINLFTKMLLILNSPPKADVGGTVDEWRKVAKSYNVISRHIIATLTSTQRGVRIPEIELALDGEYSKSTIIKCAKEGMRLGLLRAERGRYFGTNKLFDEAYERCLVKLNHPGIIEFARFVCTIHDMNRIAETTADLERDSEYKGDHKTLYEEITLGHYNEDIKRMDDDDDDGSSPPPNA